MDETLAINRILAIHRTLVIYRNWLYIEIDKIQNIGYV